MLLGNFNVFNKNPGHQIGGVTNPFAWFKGGSLMMFYSGDSAVAGQTEKASFNTGYYPPYSWILSPKGGGLSSHKNTTATLSPTAALAGGLPVSGSTTITFSETATGGLIVSGSGSAAITFSETGTLISIASGSGSSTITISGAAVIGALASISGQSTIQFTPAATIAALGYLSGLSTSEAEFSPAALARAVWEALASDYNGAGTMGQKLNGAGSAGDPWSTDIDGVYAPGTAGEYVNRIKKYVSNKLTVSGSTYSIKEDDGTTEFESGTITTTERTPS